MRLAVLVCAFAGLLAAQGSPDIVISQFYGGGGNTGATLRNDYIELFNRSKSAVNVNGWSVQYASATGTEWQVTPISGIVQPGAYYLVREAEGANSAAVDIPAPDASGTIAMSATAGKIALSRTSTALSGARPADASIVDFAGYGQPNGFEGSAPARALSNTTAALRRSNGCTDTDDNGNDFSPSEPQPRNSATAPAVNCDAISQVVPLTISQIQGSGPTSAYAGQTVSTRGVVTGRKGDGFWLQSLPADVDQNAATSEGLWIYLAMSPPGSVDRTYIVQVTGIVSEFRPASDRGSATLTELIEPRIEILGQGQPLPAPVVLTPNVDWERFEGMRVSVPELRTVSGTLGSVQESSATATSNGVFFGVLPGQARPFGSPDPADVFQKLRIDTRGQGGPAVDVSTGAIVRDLVGPLDFAFRTYSVVQDPQSPVSVQGGINVAGVLPPGPREFTVAAANLQRFFDDRDDPSTADPVLTTAAIQIRITKASRAIREFLQSPDVLAVEEVENLDMLRSLATASGNYEAQLLSGNDIGGINVGLLTKRDRVQVVSVTQEGKDTMLGTDRLWDRPPLSVRLTIEGFQFTTIVVHLRSLINADTPTVAAKRRAQAEALRDIIAARSSAGEQVIVLGDFNIFQYDPLMAVIQSGGSLINLTDTLPPDQNYSYVENGLAQTLDHILISGGLKSRLVRVQTARINSDFPESFRGDQGRVERTSDHDFPVAYFTLVPDTVQVVPAAVTNAATFRGGAVAPLEIVTIFGRGIGPTTLTFPGNRNTTSLGGTRVLFGGVPAVLIYTSSAQVSAVVPESVANAATTSMQIEFGGNLTTAITLPVLASAPGVFSLSQNGRGQGAILNQDSQVNGPSNPAERGSIVQIFGTGGGLLALPNLIQPVNVRIGGRPAEILYAGEAPGLVGGVVQINARIPSDIPAGNATLVVSVGDRTSTFDITVAVR